MNRAQFNGLYLGYGIWSISRAWFVLAAIRCRSTLRAMAIGMANMVTVMLHAVAPFRGSLDPAGDLNK